MKIGLSVLGVTKSMTSFQQNVYLYWMKMYLKQKNSFVNNRYTVGRIFVNNGAMQSGRNGTEYKNKSLEFQKTSA